MLYRAQLVSESFEEDPNRTGKILVKYKNKLRWAEPMQQFGDFSIPTKEWIEKYSASNAIGVYVSEVDNEHYLVWTGFFFYKNALPEEALVNYAYRRVSFTESWMIYRDDKVDQQMYVIEHSDGSTLRIDRTKNSESITISDAKLGNTLVMDKEGMKVNGEYVVLEPLVTWLTDNKANLGLGNLSAPVPIHPSALTDLLAKIQLENTILSKKVNP